MTEANDLSAREQQILTHAGRAVVEAMSTVPDAAHFGDWLRSNGYNDPSAVEVLAALTRLADALVGPERRACAVEFCERAMVAHVAAGEEDEADEDDPATSAWLITDDDPAEPWLSLARVCRPLGIITRHAYREFASEPSGRLCRTQEGRGFVRLQGLVILLCRIDRYRVAPTARALFRVCYLRIGEMLSVPWVAAFGFPPRDPQPAVEAFHSAFSEMTGIALRDAPR
jgi:hypothetical protein